MDHFKKKPNPKVAQKNAPKNFCVTSINTNQTTPNPASQLILDYNNKLIHTFVSSSVIIYVHKSKQAIKMQNYDNFRVAKAGSLWLHISTAKCVKQKISFDLLDAR